MNKLLIIDPQNDFCDISGSDETPALPVPGAMADLVRIAALIAQSKHRIGAITVTLDTHPSVAIERPGFWLTASGEDVKAFTVIGYEAAMTGQFRPCQAKLTESALDYLKRLEEGGKYQLMVWPAHCVLGTWGHAMPGVLSQTLYDWEVRTQTPVHKVLKGLNPLTEQYSAVRAEVPCDAQTDTNQDLLDQATPVSGGYLFVAGEASSHCVRATVLDIIPALAPELVQQIVLLTDCMSPVSGFEKQATDFFEYCRGLGVKTMTSAQAMDLIQA